MKPLLVFITRGVIAYLIISQAGGADVMNYNEPIKAIASIVNPLADLLKALILFVLWIWQIRDAYLSESAA